MENDRDEVNDTQGNDSNEVGSSYVPMVTNR